MENTNKTKKISRRMNDIRPAKKTGKYLHSGKINPGKNTKLDEIINSEISENYRINDHDNFTLKRIIPPKKDLNVYQLGKIVKSEDVSLYMKYEDNRSCGIETSKKKLDKLILGEAEEYSLMNEFKKSEAEIKLPKSFGIGKAEYKYKEGRGKKLYEHFRFRDLFIPARYAFGFNFKKAAAAFAGAGIMTSVFVGGASFWGKGMKIKDQVMDSSNQAYQNLLTAVDDVKDQDFQNSSNNFTSAYDNFNQASKDVEKIGNVVVGIAKYFPYASQLSSGKNLIEAGKHISLAGSYLNDSAELAFAFKNLDSGLESKSLLEIFKTFEDSVEKAKSELEKAENYLEDVKIDDLPKDKQLEVIDLKNKLSIIVKFADEFSRNSHILVDLLGGNGPRKYLFLFQNNQEMRATGGFIGSYGLLEISPRGEIKNFFIDGIFNPDGQLFEKVVPPKPIQKISAAWSLHDSNWFPDFPVSAEKAILFYEKTGGPTVDGIITLTPTVMEKFLEITGPINMEDYDVILDSENFIEKTQYEVEEDYDREENKPKKILADLAPMVLNELVNSGNISKMAKTINVLEESLGEKHILIYSRNEDLQGIISKQGWSGEVLDSPMDYLSVINTNVNGYKTDGVIEEYIDYKVDIIPDGSVIGTATITRKHKGGNFEYEWWNKVNSNYMRVYTPKGSKLLEVDGNTKEENESPLDYEALNFEIDSDIAREESRIILDESGTRIYEDAGKTVFANWVYVSPQEEVTIKYKYLLPFKIDLEDKSADSYSLIAQKQSGSKGSIFSFSANYPQKYLLEWNSPSDLYIDKSRIDYEGDLSQDEFIGLVFSKEEK